MAIGWRPDRGARAGQGFFYDLFKGALALFLLEMGLIVSRQAGELRRSGIALLGFGLLMRCCRQGSAWAAACCWGCRRAG